MENEDHPNMVPDWEEWNTANREYHESPITPRSRGIARRAFLAGWKKGNDQAWEEARNALIP